MSRTLTLAAMTLLTVAGGCESWRSASSCEQDSDRLKAQVTATAAWLDSVRPVLDAGFLELKDCDSISRECDAEIWLERAELLRLDNRAVQADFARAVDLWRPEACVPYVREYKINPPDPDAYRGYFFALSETGDQIEELVDRFARRVVR